MQPLLPAALAGAGILSPKGQLHLPTSLLAAFLQHRSASVTSGWSGSRTFTGSCRVPSLHFSFFSGIPDLTRTPSHGTGTQGPPPLPSLTQELGPQLQVFSFSLAHFSSYLLSIFLRKDVCSVLAASISIVIFPMQVKGPCWAAACGGSLSWKLSSFPAILSSISSQLTFYGLGRGRGRGQCESEAREGCRRKFQFTEIQACASFGSKQDPEAFKP